MTEPSTGAAFDPIALHRHNVHMLRGGDVIVAGYPGSGASLLGNMLLELGLEHLDPYTEQLAADGTARPVPERRAYRRRLAAVSARDARDRPPWEPGGGVCQGGLGGWLPPRWEQSRPPWEPGGGVWGGRPPWEHSIRFVKTHLLPEAFGGRAAHRVVLLVRDPRDAIHSYYHWRLGFSEEGEDRMFEEFLRDPGSLPRGGVGPPPQAARPAGSSPLGAPMRPVADWTRFHRLWGQYPRTPYLVTFESLKAAPVAALRGLLRAFGIARSDADLAAAAERSSFAAMRRHEDDHTPAAEGPARIMRRGMPGEWREWYRGDIVRYFSEPAFRLVARDLGYEL